jgi:hypothetical protein
MQLALMQASFMLFVLRTIPIMVQRVKLVRKAQQASREILVRKA